MVYPRVFDMGTYDILWSKAACKGLTSIFFPERDHLVAQSRAKQICNGCPVRQTCLDYALSTREPNGIWGGKTEEERRLIKTARFTEQMRERQSYTSPDRSKHGPLHLANVSLSFQVHTSNSHSHTQPVCQSSSESLSQFDLSWLQI